MKKAIKVNCEKTELQPVEWETLADLKALLGGDYEELTTLYGGEFAILMPKESSHQKFGFSIGVDDRPYYADAILVGLNGDHEGADYCNIHEFEDLHKQFGWSVKTQFANGEVHMARPKL